MKLNFAAIPGRAQAKTPDAGVQERIRALVGTFSPLSTQGSGTFIAGELDRYRAVATARGMQTK